MRSSVVALAGLAICLPCLRVLLVGAGIGTGALSVIGSALSESGLAITAGFLAVLLFAGAAAVFVRRRAEAACETGFTPTANDDGPRRKHPVAGSPRGEPRP